MAPLLIRLFLELALLPILRTPFFVRHRGVLISFCFSFYIIWWSIAPFLTSAVLKMCGNTLFAISISYALSVLADKHPFQNYAVKAFVCFWAYFTCVALIGDYPLISFLSTVSVLIEYILPAYCFMLWFLYSPGNWQRFLRVFSIVSFVVAFYYFKNRSDIGEIGEFSRAGFEGDAVEDLNVNAIYLMVLSYLPWAFISIYELKKGILNIAINILSGLTLLFSLVVLIGTGSRGAIFALLPLVLFSMVGKTSGTRAVRFVNKIIILLGVVAVAAYALLKLVNTTDIRDIRIFKLETHSGDVTTGRLDLYRYNMRGVGTAGMIVGSGARMANINGRISIANAHSIFFQIFAQSGVIGCILFFSFLLVFLAEARKNKRRFWLAMTMLGMWLFSGIGESANIMRTGIGCKALLGAGLALCARGWTTFEEDEK